jgi:hypothetical protein
MEWDVQALSIIQEKLASQQQQNIYLTNNTDNYKHENDHNNNLASPQQQNI